MQRVRILIVDDDKDVLESLVDELEARFDVQAASSGTEAIATMDRNVFDVVISDLRMPDISGVDVLEHSKKVNPEAIRILLTGYLDDDARRATQQKGAPFKIGKPWHDTVDVTLRRALEHRELERSLHRVIDDAVGASDIDDEYAAQSDGTQVAKLAAQRVFAVNGVSTVTLTMADGSVRKLSEERAPGDHPVDESWHLHETMSEALGVQIRVHGQSAAACDVVKVLIRHARRWMDDDLTTRLARRARDPDSQARLMAVTRNALLGTMASSVLHELASLIQGLHCPMMELTDYAEQYEIPEVLEATAEAMAVSNQVMQFFQSMRAFARFGGDEKRFHEAKNLVRWALLLCKSYLRKKVTLHTGDIPDVELFVDSALMVQVIVSMLKTVADASERGQDVYLKISEHAEHVALSVSSDGHRLVEEAPIDASSVDSGLGLAMTAQIVRDHGGSISYSCIPERGAHFTATLPRRYRGEAN